MTTPKERMSEERLAQLREMYFNNQGVKNLFAECIAEIDALRAELTAARTVEDGEVAEVVERQSQLAAYFDGDDVAHIPQAAMVIRAKQAISLLTRLAASLAAMRERAEFAEAQLRGTNANIAGWLAARDAQMGRANLAERQRDEALAALEKARADALEEAKSACLDLTGSDATPTLRPGARMCVRRIDHLKDQTP